MPEVKSTQEAIEKIDKQFDEFVAELGDKATKEQVDAFKAQIEELEANFSEMTESKIDASIKSVNEEVKKLHEQIAEMREEDAQSKESKTKERKEKGLLTAKELTEAVTKFIDDVNQDKGKPSIKLPSLRNKAPETFGFNQTFNGDGTGVQIDAFTGREVDPQLYQRERKSNLILDHIPITSINVPKLYYLEKEEVGDTNPTSGDPGGADWITSGAAKPKRSFRLKTGEVEAKKVAIFGTIEDKLLRDVASMENWIREDFMDEIMEKYNDGLLNNDPGVTPEAPLGMKTDASTFTVVTALNDIFALGASNIIDQIIAAAATMRDRKETPSKVFISSNNFYLIHILKANDGKYLKEGLVYTNSIGQLFIAGVEVVPVDSEDVADTHLLMISTNVGFKIRNYGSMVFERGLNGEDFREDKTSYRGYQEVLSYLPEQRQNSVMYDTLANIALGIEAAT